MGKASRKAKHEGKMARKRAVKRARREKYKALAGTSKKGKRANRKTGPTHHKHAHVMTNCGNIGCGKCFPNLKRKVG